MGMAAPTPAQLAELSALTPNLQFVPELESRRAAYLRKAARTGDMTSGRGRIFVRLAEMQERRIAAIYEAEGILGCLCAWDPMSNATVGVAHCDVPAGVTRSPVLGIDDTAGQV